MASPRELVKQCPNAIPGRASVVACVLRCQGIKCPYGGRSVGHVCAVALERDGPRRGGAEASSEADTAQGGVQPSSEADTARGGVQPSSEVDPARGGVQPSSEADPARGGALPSSEADLTRGVFRCAALVGRGGHQGHGRVMHVF
jgi:hypothetical protein